jgi:hypothetical protein
MSYEHCHENAQEEVAKVLIRPLRPPLLLSAPPVIGSCSLATEFKWHRRSFKMGVLRKVLFTFAESQLSQVTPYSKFPAQIDHAAPRAYTYIPSKEKPSWKIPSY